MPRSRPLTRAAALALAAAATVALAGCGGSGSGSGSAHKAADSVAPSSTPPQQVSAHIVGSNKSPQEVADAASLRPTASGLRTEISPLSPRVFKAPVAHYRAYSGRDADAMQQPVDQLTADLRRGDRDAARADWYSAYDHYLLLGAAYGALGDLDVAIDGPPGSQVGGVDSPRFSGLHRIEHMLWIGEPTRSIVPWAVKLQADVHKLRHVVRHIEIDPLDYATRAHEILEDAQRDMLSNVAAPWSGAGVRATADAAQATNVVIGTLLPILNGRGDALGPVQYDLQRLERELASLKRANGGAYPTVTGMSMREHEVLNARLGSTLEALSQIPGSLETQLAPVIPPIHPGEKESRG